MEALRASIEAYNVPNPGIPDEDEGYKEIRKVEKLNLEKIAAEMNASSEPIEVITRKVNSRLEMLKGRTKDQLNDRLTLLETPEDFFRSPNMKKTRTEGPNSVFITKAVAELTAPTITERAKKLNENPAHTKLSNSLTGIEYKNMFANLDWIFDPAAYLMNPIHIFMMQTSLQMLALTFISPKHDMEFKSVTKDIISICGQAMMGFDTVTIANELIRLFGVFYKFKKPKSAKPEGVPVFGESQMFTSLKESIKERIVSCK